MGLGEFLTEQVIVSEEGQLQSVGTFEYKPPFPLDIPQTMAVRALYIICTLEIVWERRGGWVPTVP